MKINPRYYIILVIVVFIVIAVLAGFFLVMPQKKKISDVDEQIAKAKSDYNTETIRQTQLQTYQKDPEQFQRQINALQDKIPENVDLADMVQELDYCAEKGGLDFYSFTPELPVQTTSFYVFNVETVFFGRYFNMVEFFNHIERLPRSIKPVFLEVLPGDDGLPYLEIRITFRVFFTTPENVELMLESTAPAESGGTTSSGSTSE
jgi:Tfp pilus assembly protein PilO